MATTTDVPAKFDIGIEGHGYMVDTQYLEAFRSRTIDPLRRQADASSSVGEASLNPEGFWRRSPESWHKGAGQPRYDASDSDPDRFYTSSGVDVWTEGQLSLLPTITEVHDLSITGAYVLRAKGNVVLEAGGGPIRTWDISGTPSDTTYAGPLGSITAFEYLGGTGWIVDSGHLYTGTNAFNSMTTPWITDDPTTITDVAVIGERLLCLDTSGNLYDISATGLATLPTALMTVGGSASSWWFRGYTSAGGYIYFSATNSGTGGEVIYKTTIKADGTALDVPTIAAEIPEGEGVYTLFGYLGFLLIGGQSGLRLAVVGADGNLTLGASFLTLDDPVGYVNNSSSEMNKFLADGEFVYVPYLLNALSYGLVRLDLSTINDALIPAYAADIGTGGTQSFISNVFSDGSGDKVMVTRDGLIYEEVPATLASTGFLSMGEVSFGTREPKQYLDPVETAEDGTVSHTLTTPGGTDYVNSNVATTEPSVTWEMTLTPTVSGNDMTVQYPILRALPAPAPLDEATIPLLLHRRVKDRNGQDVMVDTDAELDFLRGLRTTGGLIDFQDGGTLRSAQVTGVDWFASGERDHPGDQWDGMALVRMKVIPA